MKNDIFYVTAYNLIGTEMFLFERLCYELDRNKDEKNERMAEYKCAKYRLSALHRIHNMLFHGRNVIEDGCRHIDIETSLNVHTEYLRSYEAAPEGEKNEYKLYYGIKAYTESRIKEINEKLKNADDWGAVELKEKLDGYRSALTALDKGWLQRACEFPIQISNGRVIGVSAFYLSAYALLDGESERLCELTDVLDKDPLQKKERIADYKCAKYRYASVSTVCVALYHNNRLRKSHDLEYSHYLLLPYDEVFKTHTEYLALYDSAPVNERPDYSLYYGMLAFTERQISELTGKYEFADDWERVELKERIAGYEFAKECLDQAWQKREGANDEREA